MILFIFGEDSFRSNRKLQEIKNYYKKKFKNVDVFQVDFEENKDKNAIENLKSISETTSLFQEKKLIIIKNINKLSSYQKDEILSLLTKEKIIENQNITLIFYEPQSVRKTDKLIKFILENSFKKQEFKKLSKYELISFLKKEIEKQGGRISQQNLNYLINFLGDDLWNLENEIKKLISYKKDEEILKEDIENICTLNFSPGVFKITDCILEDKKNTALKFLRKAIRDGESEISILGAIIFNFRTLIKIKSMIKSNISYWEIVKESKIHPFVTKKLYPIAKYSSIEKLKKIFNFLTEIEKKIKKGEVSPSLALEFLIIKI